MRSIPPLLDWIFAPFGWWKHLGRRLEAGWLLLWSNPEYVGLATSQEASLDPKIWNHYHAISSCGTSQKKKWFHCNYREFLKEMYSLTHTSLPSDLGTGWKSSFGCCHSKRDTDGRNVTILAFLDLPVASDHGILLPILQGWQCEKARTTWISGKVFIASSITYE